MISAGQGPLELTSGLAATRVVGREWGGMEVGQKILFDGAARHVVIWYSMSFMAPMLYCNIMRLIGGTLLHVEH